MSYEPLLFYIFASLTVATGYLVVTSKNLVHAAFWTMPCFLTVACLFLLLGNELLFTVQLLIYAGAIPITLLFVLMLTREVMSEDRSERGKLWPLAIATALAFFALALVHIRSVPQQAALGKVPEDLTKQIGQGYLTTYLLPFEVASLMLLGAMVGAIYLARADRRAKVSKKEEEDASDSASALADRSDAAV